MMTPVGLFRFWGYEWDSVVYFVGFGNWFPWHYFKIEWALFVGHIVGRLFIFVFCKYIWCLFSVRIKFLGEILRLY